MSTPQFPTKKINAVLKYALNNPFSSLYQHHWDITDGILDTIHDGAMFAKNIPLITREILNASPDPNARRFVPLHDAHLLVFTSGTSGRAPFLLWRHVAHHPQGVLNFPLYHAHGATRAMLFLPPFRALGVGFTARESGMQAIIGDARNLAYSAQLATIARIDMLSMPPTLAVLFAEHFKRTDDIVVLNLYGEFCSSATYTLLTTLYPRARFIFEYGISEAVCLLFRATDTCSTPNTTMHINNDLIYPEIVDGELVITTLLLPHAMPLIRYRTGDAARFVDTPCTCGEPGVRIEMLGRINGDTLRVAGGEVKVEELDRVLTQLLPYIEPTYTLEVDEVMGNDRRLGSLTLCVTKRANISTPHESIRHELLRALSLIRLSQNMTVGDAVTHNLLAPLRVNFVPSPPTDTKHKKLVRKFV